MEDDRKFWVAAINFSWKNFQNHIFFLSSSICLLTVTASRWRYASKQLWLWPNSLNALHGSATSNEIASLQLHKNEPNTIYSERTRKDKEIGPIPSLLAQFVEKWGLLQDGGMHWSSSDLGETLSVHFTVWQLSMRMRVFCSMKINQIRYILKELEKMKKSGPSSAF
jgi:hypothetical protein